MMDLEKVKEHINKEIKNAWSNLNSVTHEYLSELEFNFGKNKEDIKQDVLDNIESLKDDYRDALKQYEVLSLLNHDLFLRGVDNNG